MSSTLDRVLWKLLYSIDRRKGDKAMPKIHIKLLQCTECQRIRTKAGSVCCSSITVYLLDEKLLNVLLVNYTEPKL